MTPVAKPGRSPSGGGEPFELPADSGTYVLILSLPFACTVAVGRLGPRRFEAGIFAYAGSALGPGGLAARLRHHLGSAAIPRWHIDFLRRRAEIQEIWYSLSPHRHEHRFGSALSEMDGAEIPVPRFGATDCRCPSHLYYFRTPPRFSIFGSRVSVSLSRWHPEPIPPRGHGVGSGPL